MADRRHVVITGGSSGIGAALTRALAADGFAVYACARRLNLLDEVTEHNTLAFGYACDVSREEDVRAFVDQVRQHTRHVDALINCAAVFGAIGPLIETETRDWFRTLEVNLGGTYLMIKHFVPLMQEDGPRIINFSGGGAFGPFANYSAYAVSKAATVCLTENLAIELARKGIAVNAVAPGFVATGIHEATLQAGPARAGQRYFSETQNNLHEGAAPIDVPVDCVRFLLSDRADGLTGKTLSASFDPWDKPELHKLIPELNASDLYTQRRINLVNLPDGELRTTLSAVSKQSEG